MKSALLIAALALANLVSLPTAVAEQAAPTEADLKAAKDAYAAGKKLFEAKKYAEAVEKFKESYRLSQNPLLLFNIALTFENLGTRDMALFYYKKFLTDAPADAAQRADAEKAVKAIEAAKAAEEAPPPDEVEPPPDDTKKPPPDEVTPPPEEIKRAPREYTIEDFEHAVVDEAPPGQPLDLMASPDDATWSVTLYYRAQGEEKFVAVPMKSHHNTLVGRIPAAVMKGNAVQYYVEVKSAAGELLHRVGKSTSPNVVYLDEAARPQYYPDLEGGPSDGGTEPRGNGNMMRGDDEAPPGFGDDPPPPGGGGVTLTPEGPGFTDVGSSKFKTAKWTATGLGVGGFGLALTFGLMASSYAASLEGEAAASNDETCTEGNPCRTFDAYRKGIEDTGQRYELISRISIGVGLVGAGVAAWFWYKEISATKRAERVGATTTKPATGLSSIITAPLVGEDLFGGAAALRF